MSQLSESTIRNVVTEVLAQLQSGGPIAAPSIQSRPGKHGVFDDADQAVAAARSGFDQLQKKGWTARAKIVEIVKKMCIDNAERWGQIEFEEFMVLCSKFMVEETEDNTVIVKELKEIFNLYDRERKPNVIPRYWSDRDGG